MTDALNTSLADKVLIFGGSAHPKLSSAIAATLALPLSPTHVRKFTNDNFYIQLGVSVRGKEVFIVQPLSPPCSEHLLELLFMLDIARGAGAKEVHAVIPYYSYARSDKKDAPRISIAARLIADLLVTAGATHVITMTLHSPQVHGFFSVPTDHLTAEPTFVKYLKQRDLGNAIVLAPDIGHAKQAVSLARALGLPVAAGEKMRTGDTTVEIRGIMGDVEGKKIILLDDEIATAGTIDETVHYLRRYRGVSQVIVLGTHGLFTGPAVARLNALDEIEEIVITDTVPLPEEHRPARLTVLSVADIFGAVIRRNVLGGSIGDLFAFWRASAGQDYESESP